MASYAILLEALKILCSSIIHHKESSSTPRYLDKRLSLSQRKFERQTSLVRKSDHIVVFTVEEALLKSTSLFPFFMLVAFEAGTIFRGLVLLVLYPLICVMRRDWGLKIMVMVTFFGINKESFYKIGRSVMPKFFLEETGEEGVEGLKTFKRKVAFTHMPRVMVESFLVDYMDVEHVVGSEIKEFHGYYLGVLEENIGEVDLEKIVGEKDMNSKVIGICGSRSSLHNHVFSTCKEIHVITRAERRTWTTLSKEKYTKPLIFHDSRLVSKPTALLAISTFMWLPFAFLLFVFRTTCYILLPAKVARPLLSFSGFRVLFSEAKDSSNMTERNPHDYRRKGLLYVCNHRTLCDPVYLKLALDKDVTALTYSLSKMSEIMSPIKTVRLTRQREQDASMMKKFLSEGNVAVCPEGTTCREPYLLRFSPLFVEMSEVIVPVALDSSFTMFYGNTASGYKFLDPLFFLMDPHPSYTIRLLEKVKGLASCQYLNGEAAKASMFELANHVQAEIGHALGFECTKLTRKDKYLILAGNDGTVKHK
ncbi:putative glycerol-3-phosphate acyltransferase 3 [Drosera capensis]